MYPEYNIGAYDRDLTISISNMNNGGYTNVDPKNIKTDKRFQDLLKKSNWQLIGQDTEEINKQLKGYHSLIIEPRTTDDVTDWVFKKSGGICYHFSDIQSIDKMLHIGIRPKNTYAKNWLPNTNVDADARVYLYAKDNKGELTPDDLNIIAYYIYQQGIDAWGCLKVDLNKYKNITLWEDYNTNDIRKPNKAVFCNTTIPAKCLSKVDIHNIYLGSEYYYDNGLSQRKEALDNWKKENNYKEP